MKKMRWAGFTLIELIVVVAIVGILAAIAYPSYLDSVRKGRRAEATTALYGIQLAQEKWRANNATYGALAACATPAAGCWVIAAAAAGTLTTEGGYYTLATAGNNATTFSATATAVSDKSQTEDKAAGVSCTPLTMTASGPTITTQAACWSRN